MVELGKLLTLLHAHGVKYILIGGVALTIHGSAYITEDMDIAYARDPENLERLAKALSEVHPRLRLADVPEGLPLPHGLDAKVLANGMNFTFVTDIGDIDILGKVSGFNSYADIQAHSETTELFDNQVLVLSLKGLLIAKRAAGRTKDQLVIPEIESMIEMQQDADGG